MNHEIYQLLQELFEQGDLKKIIRPFTLHENPHIDWELKQDMEQELILIILEYKDKKKLLNMYKRNKNELIRFLIKIVKNNVCSETSPFWKKYGMWENKKHISIWSEYETE